MALRSNWLSDRGPKSLRTPGTVWVCFNDARMGGPESLRAIDPAVVTFVRRYDGLDAQARWGVGHAEGVIFVSSREP